MKLLFISAAFPPLRAGESEHTLHLCRRLADRGVEVHLLTSQTNASMKAEESFQVHRLIPEWDWKHLPRLVRCVGEKKPDAVLLMYSGWVYSAHPMITFLPTIVRRLFPRISFMTQMEIEEGEAARTPWTRMTRKVAQYLSGTRDVDYCFGTLLRDSTQLIFLSERHRDVHAARFPGVLKKSVVIPPPPLLKMCEGGRAAGRIRGRTALGLRDEDFLLAFFGYADKNKGIETLFKAVQIVSNDMPHVKLAMIGGGRGSSAQGTDERARNILRYEDEILRLPDQLGISSHIVWLNGYDSDSDAASTYLYAADACVLPFDQGVVLSRSSLAAALAHELPVITTKGASIESPFRHEENTLLCSPKDPDGLAVSIHRLITCSELRLRLRQGARQLAEEWFSWDKSVSRLIEALHTDDSYVS
ncbi:MAG TPA: glycosyltransferase family 4 protein [Nitrospira sp.]|nr:glycosyltransferase family 4 protein [Nitrospira sp.]